MFLYKIAKCFSTEVSRYQVGRRGCLFWFALNGGEICVVFIYRLFVFLLVHESMPQRC